MSCEEKPDQKVLSRGFYLPGLQPDEMSRRTHLKMNVHFQSLAAGTASDKNRACRVGIAVSGICDPAGGEGRCLV